MTRVQPLRFRFAMLLTSLTSVAMTWGVFVYHDLTHSVQAYRLLSAYNTGWSIVAYTLALIGFALSAVSLLRRDLTGIVGLASGLAVLTGAWIRYIPLA